MGTISEKLVYLNGTKQAIKQAINEDFEVVDNNTTFREYADEISSNNAKYKDLIPKETTNATNTLDISNSSGLDKALVTQYGNTYQEGEPTPDTPQEIVNISGKSTLKDVGKNLFDKDNANILDGAYINANTGAIVTSTNDKCLYIACKPNTTYTISKTSSMRLRIGFTDTIPVTGATCNPFSGNQDAKTSYTITSGSNSNYLVFWGIDKNETSVEQQILDSIQIEENSTASTYESYKEQNFDLDLKSKNLFDNITENKLILADGTINNNASWNLGDYIKVIPNTQYTFSRYDGTSQSLIIGEYTTDKTFIQRDVQGAKNTITPYTITTTANTEYIRLNYDNTRGNTKLQFEQNSTGTDYEPFYDINLCKIGDYKDRIYYSSGKWYLEKNIGKIVLNGSEYWYNAGGNAPFGLEITDSLITISNDIPPLVYCDKFYPVSQSATWSVYDSLITASSTSTSTKIIRIRYTSISGLENFKTWLSSNNVTLYYALATPITTEITESNYPTLYDQLNNIKLYEGVNHLTFTNESGLDVEFDIEYYKDWKLD